MSRKLTIQQINDTLAPRGIKLIGEYRGAHYDTLFECSKGHVWKATVGNVKNNNRGCPFCRGGIKLTPEQITSALSPRGITLVGEYHSSHAKSTFRCAKGHTWKATLNNVKNSLTGCPICMSSWDSEGFVYILTSHKGVKIGISNVPKRRLAELRSSTNITDLSIFGIYKFKKASRSDSYYLEKQAHQYFNNHKANYCGFEGATEFFLITPEEAEEYLLSQGAIKCQEIM